ncbi:MAG TPA: sensor histidine kinase [Bryobacteraceae bacterium]|nr:sensor histidine kinase [Bryobacteraceae bacterium]
MPDLRLSGLVHDLNNVFQTLADAAELLTDDPQSAYLSDAILRAVARGQKLTASIEAAEGPIAPFEQILRDAISFIETSMAGRASRIRFTQSIEHGIGFRRTWAWDRVMINLLSNSVQAMPEGGTIHVSAAQRDGAIEIVVRDDGPGIDPTILWGVFKPHVSTRGSGLGLHIVKTIVEQDGGQVLASNRTDGPGAEFTISVPCLREEIESAIGAHA